MPVGTDSPTHLAAATIAAFVLVAVALLLLGFIGRGLDAVEEVAELSVSVGLEFTGIHATLEPGGVELPRIFGLLALLAIVCTTVLLVRRMPR